MKFTVGDKVVWTSQGRGVVKIKYGEVIAVVAAYGDSVFELRRLTKVRVPQYFQGSRRNHEGYLVAVGNKIYQPRVKDLRLDENK